MERKTVKVWIITSVFFSVTFSILVLCALWTKNDPDKIAQYLNNQWHLIQFREKTIQETKK
jgi:hypothetical protein